MNDHDSLLSPEAFLPVPAVEKELRTMPDYVSVTFGQELMQMLIHNWAAMFSLVILVAVFAGALFVPIFCPFDFAAQNVAFSNQPVFSRDPSSGMIHLFGTDHLGRDVFVRIWYGARMSLLVAFVVAAVDCFIGVAYGSISGFAGGALDTVMMRAVEVINGIPYLVVVMLLMAVLPQGIGTLIMAYTLVGWTGMARLVRGQAASMAKKEFVIAARIMGASTGRMIVRHLVPNMLGIIIVNMTLDIPGVIFTEAFLSMLGMGVPPPYPSLGTMVNEGAAVFQIYPARLAIPGIFICLVMLAFNLLGDQLQDALNPKLRRLAGYGRYPDN